jgi:ribosome recycling factor
MVARVKELAEEAKISIRNVRRDANKAADLAEKDKELSEDERDNIKEQIQDLTKQYEDKVNTMAKAKEAEVMEED